jgi:hypothetical protein
MICLISSCETLKKLDPKDIVYQAMGGKACFYDNIADLEKKKPKTLVCKELSELEGRLIIDPIKLKEILTQGIDQLITEKNQDIPK